MMKTAFRGVIAGYAVGGFLATSALREVGMAILELDDMDRRRVRTRAVSRWARWLMKNLRFDVVCDNVTALSRDGVMLVSNHLSFWDVAAIASRTTAVFVTSVEVRDTPVLGWICRAAGCVFVERRADRRPGGSAASTAEERAEVAEVLLHGFTVVLFPEATSTDGSAVLPFKRSFFSSAIAAGSPVVPMCLNYRMIDGVPLSARNRDEVFYYGDQSFGPQLARALRLRSVRIEITIMDPIPTRAAETDRRWLADQAHSAVSSRFDPVLAR
jgi:1-acyl-sn-glycerol-3-phosphate acyltransferase